jgi:hypothetical protein
MIYVVQEKDRPTGPVKVGTTGTLTQRLAALRSEHKTDFLPLFTCEGGEPLERAIQAALQDLQDRTLGVEWFRWAPNLLERVRVAAHVHAELAAVPSRSSSKHRRDLEVERISAWVPPDLANRLRFTCMSERRSRSDAVTEALRVWLAAKEGGTPQA